MKRDISNILTMVENKEISSKKAVKLIKNISEKKVDKVKPARKIKIFVHIGNENKRIKLPGIPFWLLNFLIKLFSLFTPIIIKHSQDDKDLEELINILKTIDISELFKLLKQCGSFDLVDISTGNDIVKISII